MPRAEAHYDFLSLGGGPAGLMAAMEAVKHVARVAVVEKGLTGGTCLHTGCIPMTALLRTARTYAEMRDAERYGACRPAEVCTDFRHAMERMRSIRERIGRGFTPSEVRALGIDLYDGQGRFASPTSVEVSGRVLRFEKAVVATGSRPIIPFIPGMLECGYLTNETVFDLDELPRATLVLGGGPLGCELAQAFCRLGSHVTIVQDEPMFLRREERDAAQILSEAFARDGIDVRLNTRVVELRRQGEKTVADLVTDDVESRVMVDDVLLSVGRTPNVEDIGLDAAGVAYDTRGGGVAVDDHLRTSNPHIYAAGDVWAEHQFTHIEGASSHIVVENALLHRHLRLSTVAIPWCTYTDPEIAHIGMYVREARERGIPVKTFTVPMHIVHRAIADGEQDGFVKIHVKEGTDEILGATIVARHAGELMSDIALAMCLGTGLRKLADVVYAYPTEAAAIGAAARACATSLARR